MNQMISLSHSKMFLGYVLFSLRKCAFKVNTLEEKESLKENIWLGKGKELRFAWDF